MSTLTVAYDDYLEAVVIASSQYSNWRVGQTAYNVLCTMRPELAEQIRGTGIDPFYADRLPHAHDKIATFLAHVREQWDAGQW